jgi:uncharacterized membrane protein
VTRRDARPLVTAGAVLGIGLGGFVDGILFHQLLQLHGMLTAWVPKTSIANVEINMFWDGVFSAATWTATAVGVALLFRAAEHPNVLWSRRVLGGAGLLGWGLFNAVEGVVDHLVLEVHHVVEAEGLSRWDWAFVASGVVLVAIGWLQIRAGVQADAPRPAAQASSVPHPGVA